MSATDELRRMLDERGVEWDAFSVSNTEYTHWMDKDGHWCAASIGGPLSLHVNILSATPAQAIAATLGVTGKVTGKVSAKVTERDSDATAVRQDGVGTCYPVPIYSFDGEFTEYECDACSECGTEWEGDTPNFCPYCGRKVVDE